MYKTNQIIFRNTQKEYYNLSFTLLVQYLKFFYNSKIQAEFRICITTMLKQIQTTLRDLN